MSRSLGVLGVTALLALGGHVVGGAPLHPRSRAGSGGRDRTLARRRLHGPGEPPGRRLGAGRARARLRRHGRKPGGSRPGARGGPCGDAQGRRGVRLHDRQRVRGRPRLAHHLHERARPDRGRAGAGPGWHEPVGGLPGSYGQPVLGTSITERWRSGCRSRSRTTTRHTENGTGCAPFRRARAWPSTSRTSPNAAASRRIWSASGRCWRPSSRVRRIPFSPKTGKGVT